MVATKLTGKVTTQRKLVVELPDSIQPGTVEVIVLQEPIAPPPTTARPSKAAHPAFGLWAKRAPADAATLAAELRAQIEQHLDRKG